MQLSKDDIEKFTADFYKTVRSHDDPDISLIEGEKVLLNILYGIGLKDIVEAYEWFKKHAESKTNHTRKYN